MKTLVIFSSPNANGNTYKLLKSFLDGLDSEVEFVNVYRKKISPCIDCKKCYEINGCVIKDDMTSIYEQIDSSDLIVCAFPVYFASVPAPFKSLIDRLQIYWSKKYIKKANGDEKVKDGVMLVTSGVYSDSMYAAVEETLKHVFKAVNAKDVFKVYAYRTDKMPIEENKEALDKAYSLGKMLKEKNLNK